MRTTLDIILAVKEGEPVTHEELRRALVALCTIDGIRRRALNDLLEALEERPATVPLRVQFALDTRERMFRALKADPVEWLGPEGIPGHPEHDARYLQAIAVARKAGIF